MIVVDHPVAGLYKFRARRRAPWSVVEIAPYGSGERAVDFPVLCCFVNGAEADVVETWHRCAGNPITKAEYQFRLDDHEWTKKYAPSAPEADPRRPVDLDKIPPAF